VKKRNGGLKKRNRREKINENGRHQHEKPAQARTLAGIKQTSMKTCLGIRLGGQTVPGSEDSYLGRLAKSKAGAEKRMKKMKKYCWMDERPAALSS